MGTGAGAMRTIYYRYAKDSDTFKKIDGVIQQNLPALRRDGVLTVRPGYQMVGGWPTQKPAIVVTVRQKSDAVPAAQLLPEKLGGFTVDVRQASSLEKLRADDPARFAAFAATARNEYRLPEFSTEREIATGTPVKSLAMAASAAKPVAKPEIPYTRPEGFTLDLIEDNMSILCHASPDAGWPTLKSFFEGITNKLVVGMYDFTAAHILQELTADLKKASLMLTLDDPPKNPTADQPDDQTVADLKTALNHRMQFAWALEEKDPKAPVWIYPSAYHIKVAVSDSATMWLSSGNWNRSNQPDIDPVKDPEGSAAVAKNSDRDWHVIVHHAGLSKTYEAYLQNDYDVANIAETSAAPKAALAAVFPLTDEEVSNVAVELSTAARAPLKYFAPKLIPANGTTLIKIQPILTPDNYCAFVLPLIQSSKKSFYMQTQYIHPSDLAKDQQLADLISAVAELQKKGLDVRLILSQWETQGTGGYLEKLQAAGIDLAAVRIQTGVHNKGIVVDSSVVMLGSQNWSGDGVIRNRDASLIIYNTDAAQYYEQIFLEDWINMAQQATAKS
jgi:hypothetical protein